MKVRLTANELSPFALRQACPEHRRRAQYERLYSTQEASYLFTLSLSKGGI